MSAEAMRERVAERIRSACEKMGADEEMIALVVASHRHNPEALDALMANGGDLLGYVRSRMARWKAIFEGD